MPSARELVLGPDHSSLIVNKSRGTERYHHIARENMGYNSLEKSQMRREVKLDLICIQINLEQSTKAC
jgi:hypothetical protein